MPKGLDTNILVYALDSEAGRKHEIAYSMVEEESAAKRALLYLLLERAQDKNQPRRTREVSKGGEKVYQGITETR